MIKRISGADVREAYGLTHMDLFSAIEGGLSSYDGFGRKIPSLSDRHAQIAKAFRECVYKGITGEDPGEDSAVMVGESSQSKGYIPNNCELMSLDSRLFDAVDLVNLFPAPCESSVTESCKDAVRCFDLAPAEDAPAPVAEAQAAPVVDSQADKDDNAAVQRSAYLDHLERQRDTKKWNALAAYFHASVEGGENSNDRIAEITKHKGKIADLIDRGESIASREGLPLLTMPPKREKQKGARPPRH